MSLGKAPWARLAVLGCVGVIAATVAWSMRSPLAISEAEARRLVETRELIGLALEEAGKLLQAQVPGTRDGTVVVDFKQVKEWRAGPLTLDVRGGKVTAATWGVPQSGE